MSQALSIQEYADIVFVYGYANGNAAEARREYARRYPQRTLPSERAFSRTFQRLRETGILASGARERSINLPVDQVESVLEVVRNDPSTSTRRIVGVSHASVWRILSKEQLHPYHLTPVQELLPSDYPLRVTFCEWLQNAMISNLKILWTDESTFTKDGIFNNHNEHRWAPNNPHEVKTCKSQFKFSVNVWAGMIGETLVGPHIFDENLNGRNYANFLSDTLPSFMEDVPLIDRRDMIFQHDGAPAHFARQVKDWLDDNYSGRWVGRNGLIRWPPRSPDLTPLDFYLWGRLKSLVYAGPISNRVHLIEKLSSAVSTVREEMRTIDSRSHLLKRAGMCIQHNGRLFENLL